MTREEAIKLLVNATYSDEWQGNEQLTKENLMAIEALSERSAPRCKAKYDVQVYHAQGSKILGKEAEFIIDEANAYKREKGESHE